MTTPRWKLTKTPIDNSTGAPTVAQQNTPKMAPLANQLEPAMLGTPPVRAKKRATLKAAISVAPLARAYSRGPSVPRKVSGD